MTTDPFGLNVEDDDDGYGVRWDYRVFSHINTEPETPETGRRYLTVHHVDYGFRWRNGTPDYPIPDDVICIEARPAAPSGIEIEEAIRDAERIRYAFDRPALIRAEWKNLFVKPINFGG